MAVLDRPTKQLNVRHRPCRRRQAARLAERRREKIYIFTAALLLSTAVGFSRVYLGVHYPTDVVAGWAAGVAWAQVCWFSAHLIGRRRLARTAAEA